MLTINRTSENGSTPLHLSDGNSSAEMDEVRAEIVRGSNLSREAETAKLPISRVGEPPRRAATGPGGPSSLIILEDTDIDHAVRTAMLGSRIDQNRILLSVRNIIVQRKIAHEFLGKLSESIETLPAASFQELNAIIDRHVAPAAIRLVDDRVQEALRKGAKLLVGGVCDGHIYQPTILTNVSFDAAVANGETFGSVVIVEIVDTPEQAVEAAIHQIGRSIRSTLARQTVGRMHDEVACVDLTIKLIQIGPSASTESSTAGSVDNVRIRRVLDYIDANIKKDLTLAELARIAGHSPFHFARTFTLAMGISPRRYINRLRLDGAMAELATGKLALAQIALNAHFSSQASFTRAFHRVTGMTPKEYQRNHATMPTLPPRTGPSVLTDFLHHQGRST